MLERLEVKRKYEMAARALLLALVTLHGQVTGMRGQIDVVFRVADLLLPLLLFLRLLALTCLLLLGHFCTLRSLAAAKDKCSIKLLNDDA